MFLRDALKGNLHCALFGHSFLLIFPLNAAWRPPWQLSKETSWNLLPNSTIGGFIFPFFPTTHLLLPSPCCLFSIPHSYSAPSSLCPTPLPLPLNFSVPLVPLILSLLPLLFSPLSSFLFFSCIALFFSLPLFWCIFLDIYIWGFVCYFHYSGKWRNSLFWTFSVCIPVCLQLSKVLNSRTSFIFLSVCRCLSLSRSVSSSFRRSCGSWGSSPSTHRRSRRSSKASRRSTFPTTPSTWYSTNWRSDTLCMKVLLTEWAPLNCKMMTRDLLPNSHAPCIN